MNDRARAHAPGGLILVERFINTRHLPAGPDALASISLAAAWLLETIGSASAMSEKDRLRLGVNREKLRSVLEMRGRVDSDLPLRLQRLLGRASMRAIFTPEGAKLSVSGAGVN